VELLLVLWYDAPGVRPLALVVGLPSGRPARTSGYDQLEAAVDRLGFYGADGRITASGYAP
jgi:hypothetical protein